MNKKDVINMLIDHGVLICEQIVKEPNITGLGHYSLSKKAIRHNSILESLDKLERKI
jgi:hypothetical protein